MSSSCFAEALRIIGYDLEFRGIKTLILSCEADRFILKGGYQSPPAVTPLTLYYGSGDISQLESDLAAKNNNPLSINDLLGLSQILWAIGNYVTAKECRLLSICNTHSTEVMPVFQVEYETMYGDHFIEDLMGSAIYELSLSAYKSREASDIKDVRYTRFTSLQQSS